MCKLDDLLQRLCPDGVEYKRLGEIAEITRGGSFQKKNFLEVGFPCIHYGQIYTYYGLFANKTITFVDKKVAAKQKIAHKGDIVMAVTSENIEDVCKSVAWLGDCDIAVSGHTAIISHNQNPKYLSYYFHSIHFQNQKNKIAHGTKVLEVTPSKLNDIIIPVPPLEVQREIVCIMDNFAELTTELTAELFARRKQYEYYRDSLLTFGDDVPMVKLGDVCNFVRGPFGGSLKKEIFIKEGYAVYEQANAIYGKLDFRYFISADKFKSMQRFAVKPGDLIMSCSGTMGKTFIIPKKAPEGIINQALLKLTPNSRLNSVYLKYIFDNSLSYEMNRTSRGGAIKNVPSVGILKELLIPLPSIAEQERIVSILDRFDTLCNDLTSGLPAEIEARQKQYEYYRDKLLDFKKAE